MVSATGLSSFRLAGARPVRRLYSDSRDSVSFVGTPSDVQPRSW